MKLRRLIHSLRSLPLALAAFALPVSLLAHPALPPGVPAPPQPRGQQGSAFGNGSATAVQGLSGSDIVTIPGMADLGTNEVLEMLENLTGREILRQQTLPPVRINFTARSPLTRDEAILAVENLLALNGIAITEVGPRFLKAVPIAKVAQQVPPLIIGSTLEYPASQKYYATFFDLDFLTPTEAINLIVPLLSQGRPLPLKKDGSLFVTDALINLQRIEDYLARVDSPKEVDTAVLFIQLEHTSAEEIVRTLQSLQDSTLRRYLENNTTFDADERTNQVIVFTHPSNQKLIETIVGKLDIDVAPATSTEIYYIRHAEAVTISDLLQQIVSGQQEVREDTQGRDTPAAGGNNQRNNNNQQANNQQAQQQQRQAQRQQARQTATESAASENNLQFSDFLTIVADERSNAIVVTGTPSDQTFVKELIDKLDILLAQVRIEVVIAEVTLGNDFARGIDAFGPLNFQDDPDPDGGVDTGFNTIFGGTDENGNPTSSTLLTAPAGALGAAPFVINGFLTDGGEFDIDFILNRGRTLTEVQILQNPTITTTHNREASISVGQQRPVITGTQSNLGTDTVTTSLRSTVQFRDIELELTVLPLIGDNGIIQLEITQTVQSIVDTVDVDGNEQPVIGNREATSFVGVRDGELIILGGLQSTENRETNSKIFILGDLPLLGPIFRSKTTSEDRTELIIFIKPTVIQNTDVANTDANEVIDRYLREEKIENYLDTGRFTPKDDVEDD